MKFNWFFIICLCTTFHLSGQSIRLVKDLTPGTASTFNNNETEGLLVPFENKVAFPIQGETGTYQLWASDGTADGTQLLYDFADPQPFGNMVNADTSLLFSALPPSGQGSGLWATDLTPEGTRFLYDFGITIDGISVTSIGIYAWGRTYEGQHYEVWRYEAGEATLIHSNGTFIGQILSLSQLDDATIVFFGRSEEGRALFRSDGTPEGTQPYFLINEGSEFGQRPEMTRVGDKVFFFYDFPESASYTLFVTDGTTEGTLTLGQYRFPSFSDKVPRRIAWNGKFFFGVAPEGAPLASQELYCSDGTVAGTIRFDTELDRPLRPAWFTPYKGLLYFRSDYVSVSTFRVLATDGTPAGTEVKISGSSLGSGFGFGGSYLTVYKDHLFFRGFLQATGSELVKSDGSDEGTVMLDLATGSTSSNPEVMTPTADNGLFFIASTPQTGRELFVYDGPDLDCPLIVTTIEAEICEGDTFEFEGAAYTEAGDYPLDTLFSVQGCDSIIQLTLQVFGPEVDLGGDQIITTEDTLLLTVPAGFASVLWSDGSTEDSLIFDATQVAPGEYVLSVTVEDENGCTTTDEITITVQMPSATHALNRAFTFSVAPNPIRSGESLQVQLSRDGAYQIALQDMKGQLLNTQSVQVIDGQVDLQLPAQLSSGTYVLTTFNAEGQAQRSVTIVVIP